MLSAYLLLALLMPINRVEAHHYMLSAEAYHVLRFSLALPLAILWLVAFYGAERVRMYARSVAKTPEGKAYAMISKGCSWLAWGLILVPTASLVLKGIVNVSAGFRPTMIIIINYLELLFTIISFSYIATGARQMAAHAKRTYTPTAAISSQVIFIAGGVLYGYLTFRHLDLLSITSTHNPYFMPVWLIIISIIIPSLYAWFIGLLAAYDIILTSQQSQGVLYRKALQLLAFGLVILIGGLIAIQYLHTVSPRTGLLSLSPALALTYAIYMIMMLGFTLVFLGSRQLKRIEEV